MTTFLTVIMVLYATTLKDRVLRIGGLYLSLAIICMVAAIFLRPKDEGAGIKLLHLQFFLFAIISEIVLAVGNFRAGYRGHAWIALIRMVLFWPFMYALGLKLRRKAAQLSPAELSNFLCKTVLLGGVRSVVPILFFTFETLSCYLANPRKEDMGMASETCSNTMIASMFLSAYLAVFTCISTMSKVVPGDERGEVLTYDRLTVLRLGLRQQVQGALLLITALASMCLFSVLGVKGSQNVLIDMFGGAGLLTSVFAVLIEMIAIAFGESREPGQPAGTS